MAKQAKPRVFRAVLEQEGEWIVARAPELDVTTQGYNREDALSMLREAISLRLRVPEDQVTVSEDSFSSRTDESSSGS